MVVSRVAKQPVPEVAKCVGYCLPVSAADLLCLRIHHGRTADRVLPGRFDQQIE
jgi:hypothetical protein